MEKVSTKQHYVYELCYPDGTPFYIGKGQKKRVYMHEINARKGDVSAKCKIIRKIWESGGQLLKKIVFESDDNLEAFNFEKQHISVSRLKYKLTNVAPGGMAGGRQAKGSNKVRLSLWVTKAEKAIVDKQPKGERVRWVSMAIMEQAALDDIREQDSRDNATPADATPQTTKAADTAR